MHEAQVDLPDGSARNDAPEGKRGGCDAPERRQGIHRERDARCEVPTEDGIAQVGLLRQPARKCCIKVAGRDELREPERRAQQDMRIRAVEEEGELGEPMHIVQRVLQ